jgi:hypothetical protein
VLCSDEEEAAFLGHFGMMDGLELPRPLPSRGRSPSPGGLRASTNRQNRQNSQVDKIDGLGHGGGFAVGRSSPLAIAGGGAAGRLRRLSTGSHQSGGSDGSLSQEGASWGWDDDGSEALPDLCRPGTCLAGARRTPTPRGSTGGRGPSAAFVKAGRTAAARTAAARRGTGRRGTGPLQGAPPSFDGAVQRSTRFTTAFPASEVLRRIAQIAADPARDQVVQADWGGFTLEVEREGVPISTVRVFQWRTGQYLVEFCRRQLDIFQFKRFYETVRRDLATLVKRDGSLHALDSVGSHSLFRPSRAATLQRSESF